MIIENMFAILFVFRVYTIQNELSSYWVFKLPQIVPLLNHLYRYLGIICIILLILFLVPTLFLFCSNILISISSL
jgi:hypothetical protein